MKPLSLQRTDGPVQRFDCLGWLRSKPHDWRRKLLVLDPAGNRSVLDLRLDVPNYFDRLLRGPTEFLGEPFPEAVCVDIRPCRLMPPPRFESEELFREKHRAFERWEKLATVRFRLLPWEWKYWRTHKEALWLTPADDGPLHTYFQSRSSTPLRDYQRSFERLQAAIEDPRQAAHALTLQCELNQSRSACETLCDAYLVQRWAAKSGVDLEAMARARSEFLKWIRRHVVAEVELVGSSRAGRTLRPVEFGERPEEDPQFLSACAAVRYRAEFADNERSVVYLADCDLRGELLPDEFPEADRLRPTPAAPAESPPWFRHSADFRHLFWNENDLPQKAELTKKQASAFAALYSATGRVLSKGEWSDAIYADSPPSDFRPDKLFHYKDGRRVYERFIRVRGDRYSIATEATE